MRRNWISSIVASGLTGGLLLAGGCKGPAPAPDSGAGAGAGAAGATAAAPKVNFGTDVGIPLPAQTANPAQLQNLYASLDVRPRQDPFSLLPQEKAFDREQAAERLVQQSGTMDTMYEPPAPPDDTPEAEEPQPYRRVSGILVGDSVLAIIEMGEGSPEIVRPGQYVKGTPWFVVSIDEEKVVLRRAGNVKPKEITVRLEQRPGGATGGATNPGPGAQGGRGGGNSPIAGGKVGTPPRPPGGVAGPGGG